MSKKAILLTNLGSPDSTGVSDVRRYLDEFLMDERVIDVPYILRFLLVKGIIVPFRAPKSAAKYKTIWTENGSPLVHLTNSLQQRVAQQTEWPVYVCMRYANPTPQHALNLAAAEHPDLEELLMLPLYPHYAMSSYETAVEHVKEAHRKGGYSFSLKVIPPYYRDEQYINALAESIKPFVAEPFDHLLFSYHGIPERHIRKSDVTGSHCLSVKDCCNVPSRAHEFCYRHQVHETTRLVAEKLGLPAGSFSLSFQSRLGSDKWLQPYTAAKFSELPKQGVKKLLVACPAFVSDCLETLEEINEEGREIFIHAGGEEFVSIPCLNVNALWVETIKHLVNQQIKA